MFARVHVECHPDIVQCLRSGFLPKGRSNTTTDKWLSLFNRPREPFCEFTSYNKKSQRTYSTETMRQMEVVSITALWPQPCFED